MDPTVDVKSEPSIGFSFKFQNTVKASKVDKSKISIEAALKQVQQEFVLSVEDKRIKSSKPDARKQDLVIPLIKANNWRLPPKAIKKEPNESEAPKTLDEQAANEIIAQTQELLDQRNKAFQNDTMAIPLILQNKCPEGFETDDKLDVSLRPDPSTMEDYERIPVDKFGLAMLRGMGWKPGAPIGLKNKQCVELIEVVVRPKGLGLGADKKSLAQLKNKDEDGKLLILKQGAFVNICEGNNKGLYGQVESMDDETGRVYIKLAVSGQVIHLPELFLQPVSEKEFLKNGRNTKTEKTKDGDATSTESTKKHKKKKRHSSPDTRSRSRSPVVSSKHKKDKRKESSQSCWLIPQIRVRFIDERYKRGKFFKTKVIIEDILTPTCCICRTDNGEVLEDIHPKMLETVIPRSEPGYIMIVRGPYKGVVGKILDRNKSSCIAAVQLFPDNNVAELSYDDISEFVGDVSQFD